MAAHVAVDGLRTSSDIAEGAVFPRTRRKTVSVDGIDTEVVTQLFEDCVFVMVTQLGKLGTIISVPPERANDGSHRFEPRVLLGRRDDPLLLLYARQIAEQVSKEAVEDRTVMAAIALKPDGRAPAIFQAVINAVLELRVW